MVEHAPGARPASQQRVKRGMDVALSLFALGLFAPVQAVAATCIALEDRGELLFKQVRVGRHGRSFLIYKLRTMRDGRVTRVGRWLRATGIDETPQFFNVLRGDMSIVGPRPLTAEDLERYGWTQHMGHQRFLATPGITGLGQVYGDGSPRRVRALDALYSRVSSPALDLQLIAVSFAMNVVGKATVKRWIKRARSNGGQR